MSSIPVARLNDTCSGHHGFHPTKIISGSSNVIANNLPVARQGDEVLKHKRPNSPYHNRYISGCSTTTIVNSRGVARIGDAVDCGGLVVDYQKAIGNACLLHDIGHPSFGPVPSCFP